MALSKAFSDNAIVSIKLRKLPTLPTTEDLLYLLATATKNKKPAELPFKNPYNNISFVVKVVPATTQLAPRWTFERCTESGNVFLWTRESNEVIMVQGKIKIESNYTGIPAQKDEEQLSQSGQFLLPEQNLQNSPNQQYGVDWQNQQQDQPGLDDAEEASEPTGKQAEGDNTAAAETTTRQETSPPAAQTRGSGQPIILGSPVISASNLAAMGAAQDEVSNHWMLNENYRGPVKLPPPVVLNPEVVRSYLSALSNPQTGLLRQSAFEFFLLRDSMALQKRGGKLAVLVFDFINPDTQEPPSISKEAASILADLLSEFCGPLELFTQLKSGEFAILLSGHDGESALKFAEKLCSKLPQGATELSILADLKTLAVGVACIPETCHDPGTLVAAAIKAKNMARQSQRRCMLFPLF